MATDWGAIFSAMPADEEKPYCTHRDDLVSEVMDRLVLRPEQAGEYSLTEDGDHVYCHSYFHWIEGSRWRSSLLSICGKPYEWQWRAWMRICGDCGKKYSNPWVPVCAECWDDPNMYPSWEYIIASHRAVGNRASDWDLEGFDHSGKRFRLAPTEADRRNREYLPDSA